VCASQLELETTKNKEMEEKLIKQKEQYKIEMFYIV
jgi:hypothetical protein